MAWTVLLVDDSRTIHEIVRMTLRMTPFSLVTASSMAEGLDAARRARPDVVLADMRLPDGDGYDFCRTLKADSELAAIPVLLFIGSGLTPDVGKSKEVRAMGFFPKPFSSQDLIDQLTLLSEARSRRVPAAEPLPATPVPPSRPASPVVPVDAQPEPFAFDAEPAPLQADVPFEATPETLGLDMEPALQAGVTTDDDEPLIQVEPFDFAEPVGDDLLVEEPEAAPEWRLEDETDLIRTDAVLSQTRREVEADPMGLRDDAPAAASADPFGDAFGLDFEPPQQKVSPVERPDGPITLSREEASFLLEEIGDEDEEGEVAREASAGLEDDYRPEAARGGAMEEFGLETLEESEPAESIEDLDVLDDLESAEDLGLEPIDDLELEPIADGELLQELPVEEIEDGLEIEDLEEDLARPLPEDDAQRASLYELRQRPLSDFMTPVPRDAVAEREEFRDLEPVTTRSERPATDDLSFSLEEDALPSRAEAPSWDSEDVDLARAVPHVEGDLDADHPVLPVEDIITESEPEIDAVADDAASGGGDLTFDLAEEEVAGDVEIELYEMPADARVVEGDLIGDAEPASAALPTGDDIVLLFRRAVREELAALSLPETRLAPGAREAIREIVRGELVRVIGETPRRAAPSADTWEDEGEALEPMDQTELLTAVRQAVRHEVTETLESVVVEAVEGMLHRVTEAASAPVGPAELEDIVGRISGREIAVALESFPKPYIPPSTDEIADALNARLAGPLDEIRRALSALPRYERLGEDIHTWIHSALGEIPTSEEIRALLAGSAPAPAAVGVTPSFDATALRAMLHEELAGLVGERIEAVAWEVVPDLAEQIIKKELDRLTT